MPTACSRGPSRRRRRPTRRRPVSTSTTRWRIRTSGSSRASASPSGCRGARAETGLVVPKAALLHDAYGGTWVYVVREPQVYSRQRVVVTDISGPLAVLSQGPVEGMRVVTDGAAELFGVEFGAGK